MTRDRFPIQGGLTVSWEAAEQAYKGYVSRFGANQTLERLAERGGFGVLEFIRLFSHDRPWARRDQNPTDVEMATALSKGDIRSVAHTSAIPMDVEAVRAAIGAPPKDTAGLELAIQYAESKADGAAIYNATASLLRELRRRRQDDDQADVRHPSLRVTSDTVVRLGRIIRTLAIAIMRLVDNDDVRPPDKVVDAVKAWVASSHIDWLYPPDRLGNILQGDS